MDGLTDKLAYRGAMTHLKRRQIHSEEKKISKRTYSLGKEVETEAAAEALNEPLPPLKS